MLRIDRVLKRAIKRYIYAEYYHPGVPVEQIRTEAYSDHIGKTPRSQHEDNHLSRGLTYGSFFE